MFTSTCYSRRQRNPHTHEEKTAASPFFSFSGPGRNEPKKGNAFFQAKMAIGKSGDKYEHEADNVAHAVTQQKKGLPVLQAITGIQRLATPTEDEKLGTNDARMRMEREIRTKPIQAMGAGQEKEKKEVQKKDEHAKEEDEKKKHAAVQTKADAGGGTAAPHVASRIESSAGKGNKMPASTLREMNASFGTDFNHVRIHTDREATALNKELQAQAFTHGNDIYFNEGKYDPGNSSGRFLLAHELTHVVQQRGGPGMIDRKKSSGSGTPLNFVCYSGGYQGVVSVFKDGKLVYTAPAVSGNAGSKQNQKDFGPTPDGQYVIHPEKTNRKVTKPEGGTCSVGGIDSGYQEISAADQESCDHHSHYCNVPCTESPTYNCYTPVGCWGTRRIRIEGSRTVVRDDGKKITRDGFFLHGGNPSDLASSGCIKALDNNVFDKIRELKGAVPFFVGTNCPGQDLLADIARWFNIVSGNEASMEDKSPKK